MYLPFLIFHPKQYIIIRDQDQGRYFRLAPDKAIPEGFEKVTHVEIKFGHTIYKRPAYREDGTLDEHFWALKRWTELRPGGY